MLAAIGDVHGCADELKILLERLERKYFTKPGTIVMLGDYIDRGPDSNGVLDIISNWANPNIELICLWGNHERMMVNTVLHHDREMAEIWLDPDSGGMETILSMGDRIGDHAKWMEKNLKPFWRARKHFFVHAGLDPDIKLVDQIEDDMLWITQPFLSYMGKWEDDLTIVHGHSPVYGHPVHRGNRLGIDTGCVFGFSLSAAIFDNDEYFVGVESVKNIQNP